MIASSTPPKNLLIIDGFNILYRSFHGHTNLTGPNGQPTGAIHGFMKTLNMLRNQFEGHQVVITLDPFPHNGLHTGPALGSPTPRLQQLADLGDSGPSRKDILPSYKATRSAMPEDLQKQLLPLTFILQGHGYPILQGNHYAEADDLLATIATLAVERGAKVVIGSGDKDTMALVKDGSVRVFNPNTNKVMLESDVFEKFGVYPDKIEDFLALMGDAVDCIPGVPKCGEKTAAKWLSLYGDLAGVIANADSIKGVVGDNLRASLAHLPIARSLTSLKRNLPVDYESATAGQPMDVQLLTTMYQQLGMKTALSQLNAFAPEPTP
jgi:DNA polymerase-1